MTFELWLLLILLGLMTYSIVQRSVAHLTRTPVWLLWLVMMIPAFSWVSWIVIYGEKKPIPVGVLIALCLSCPFVYGWLVHLGQKNLKTTVADPNSQNQPEQSGSQMKTAPEPTPLRPINLTEEADLKNCFSWSIYSIQSIEYRPQAIICRGQLRSEPGVAYQTIRENIEARFADRFLVIFEEGLNGKPFFIIVPNALKNTNSQSLTRPKLALALLFFTFLTTTIVGTNLSGISPQAIQANPVLLLKGIPYACGLIAILGIHELGHYLMARFYKIRTTLPYFIPVPAFLGTFGAFISIRSPIPNRKALFDVSIAGPAAGLVITFPLLIWGLAHSHVVDLSSSSHLLNFNSLNPRFSLLLTLLSKLSLGNVLTAKSAINLHPVAVAGYLGLIVTALNLMPVGQLDGGHIVHAMFGRLSGAMIGQVSRFLLLILAISQLSQHTGLFVWAIFLFLMPIVDEPALNDVSDLDNHRDFWGLAALFLLVMILLPAPQKIMDLFQI